MQCASCRFENMPGIVVCGRCGARLELATASLDVHPPRATPGIKRLRRWLPWYGLFVRLWDWGAESVRKSFPYLEAPRAVWGVFVRMVVPGWPQFFTGQTIRGRILLWGYLALLLLGIVFVGTSLGSLLLGCALAFHGASIIDVVWAATNAARTRAVYAVMCLAVLGTVVYFPVAWAATRVAVPRRLMMDATPFVAGDVILYNPSVYRWSDPAPGDIVLYRVPSRLVPTRTPGGQNAVYRIEGEYIDRLLAGPGQNVRWEGGVLWVDGQPSPWLPLNAAAVPAGLQWTVPAGCYLVLPSTMPYNVVGYPFDIWIGMSVVPRESVLGRVFLRHQPLTRWWRVR